MESWEECGQRPREEHTRDGVINANQYHKMTRALYQWEVAIDELIKKWYLAGSGDWKLQEWQRIKDGAKSVCMDMRKKIEAERMNESENTASLMLWAHDRQP